MRLVLGFNRHSVGKKYITLDAFPEDVFVSLFENEDNFKYIPSQRKYQCILEGTVGEEQLKKIFKYDQIIFHENINTSTRGYILFENNDGQYKVIFNWKQKELKENTRCFLSGILTINFTADSGEFINDQENYVSPPQPPSSTVHLIMSI
ncbi:hypothetical protein GLOIN_2v1791375 [Rhizophagus irregularis DAOM 181602=DAOM 197198]|nr:hypothetical protein GLOIN_2v1791375 [Rhizophagus irregularis DAOM 181602=DAOM 197198]